MSATTPSKPLCTAVHTKAVRLCIIYVNNRRILRKQHTELCMNAYVVVIRFAKCAGSVRRLVKLIVRRHCGSTIAEQFIFGFVAALAGKLRPFV